MEKIGVIIFYRTSASEIPCNNLLGIITKIYTDIKIISIRNLKINCLYLFPDLCNSITYTPTENFFKEVLNYILIQIKIIIKIINTLPYRYNIWCIFIGETSLIPILLLKIFRKKIILILPGSLQKELSLNQTSVNTLLKLFSHWAIKITDKVIVYSPNLIKEWRLENYRHKILIAHEHFLDFATFTVITPFPDRPHLISYIGRFSAEKGVQHFVQALPVILSECQELRLLIGGDGQLMDSIKASIDAENISDRVDLPGWISHEDLPKFLNQFRLLVLPSYTEGLPNIMLEAMACGTPVLATPVGAIPDVIRDGETGFIMEDNSPKCIARNVMRALNHPDLEGVAERGRMFVREEYTFEKAVERWGKIIEK